MAYQPPKQSLAGQIVDVVVLLVNVPVEDGHVAVRQQEVDRLPAVEGGPVPPGIEIEQGAVGKDDDRGILPVLIEIGGKPGELLVADQGPRFGHVVNYDKMHPLVVEGVMRVAEKFPVRLAVVE